MHLFLWKKKSQNMNVTVFFLSFSIEKIRLVKGHFTLQLKYTINPFKICNDMYKFFKLLKLLIVGLNMDGYKNKTYQLSQPKFTHIYIYIYYMFMQKLLC